MELVDLITMSHSIAKQKGFWKNERNFGELIALCHSELSEAIEESRLGLEINYTYYDSDKPCGIPSELADCVIRILDMCGYYGIDLESVILEKLQYNTQRGYKHGKEF